MYLEVKDSTQTWHVAYYNLTDNPDEYIILPAVETEKYIDKALELLSKFHIWDFIIPLEYYDIDDFKQNKHSTYNLIKHINPDFNKEEISHITNIKTEEL